MKVSVRTEQVIDVDDQGDQMFLYPEECEVIHEDEQ